MISRAVLAGMSVLTVMAGSAMADGSRHIDASQARELAIAFAKADQAHSYGGELPIERATTVLRTKTETKLFELLSNTEPSAKDMLQKLPLNFLVHAHIVMIQDQGCAEGTNFLAVSDATGEVRYLFRSDE